MQKEKDNTDQQISKLVEFLQAIYQLWLYTPEGMVFVGITLKARRVQEDLPRKAARFLNR